jgi:hypothetical protein
MLQTILIDYRNHFEVCLKVIIFVMTWPKKNDEYFRNPRSTNPRGGDFFFLSQKLWDDFGGGNFLLPYMVIMGVVNKYSLFYICYRLLFDLIRQKQYKCILITVRKKVVLKTISLKCLSYRQEKNDTKVCHYELS